MSMSGDLRLYFVGVFAVYQLTFHLSIPQSVY
jgi:hypothetical protein